MVAASIGVGLDRPPQLRTNVQIPVGIDVATNGLVGTKVGVEYDGRNLYVGYCSSCHGPSGAGDGPVAAGMAFKLEDLRTLEVRRGEFPADWLREVIDGRTLRAVHGTNDMPVWGWQFLLEEESEEQVAARIDALVEYLRSVQISG